VEGANRIYAHAASKAAPILKDLDLVESFQNPILLLIRRESPNKQE
jgi:hypothetical protein